ncbi:MFS transporter [Nonomuraea pusilla]
MEPDRPALRGPAADRCRPGGEPAVAVRGHRPRAAAAQARSLALVVWVGTLGSVLGPNLGAPGEVIGAATGLTVYAAAFLIAAVCLAVAGLIVFVWLRPDPLLFLGRATPASSAGTGGRRPGRIRQVLAELRVNQRAQVAVLAILTAQVVMVAIMTMTPVHLTHHGGSITVVGITISLHVAGMYAPSPLVGLIADRHGHRAAISAGLGVLAAPARHRPFPGRSRTSGGR